MIYLLDTNVVSEVLKPIPNVNVIEWLTYIKTEHMAISVVTLGEISKGIELTTPNSTKRIGLTRWLEIDLVEWFEDRIISINTDVADKWGYICAQTPKIPATDAFLAATALVYNMKMVTRNVKDFGHVAGLEIVNPWEE